MEDKERGDLIELLGDRMTEIMIENQLLRASVMGILMTTDSRTYHAITRSIEMVVAGGPKGTEAMSLKKTRINSQICL